MGGYGASGPVGEGSLRGPLFHSTPRLTHLGTPREGGGQTRKCGVRRGLGDAVVPAAVGDAREDKGSRRPRRVRRPDPCGWREGTNSEAASSNGFMPYSFSFRQRVLRPIPRRFAALA